MKKILSLVLAAVLLTASVLCFASCEKKSIQIGVPNDATNELRALQLLEAQGIIKLKEGTDENSVLSQCIAENPYNVSIVEIEAAQLPSRLADLDYAVINSNYAINAKLSPFVTEGTDVSYPNYIAVKSGNENSAKIKALCAAANSQAVVDYLKKTYNGVIVCDLTDVSADGYDSTINYAELSGTTITIAVSPEPHAGIMNVVKEILAAKNITLNVVEYTDYVEPMNVVENGECDANFFAHKPYIDQFNSEHGTSIKEVLAIHHEPMGVYSSTNTDWSAVKGK